MKLKFCLWLEHLWKQQIYLICFKWVWSGMPRYTQSYAKKLLSLASSQE